ncbi:putative SNAP25 homologous protein SNAP30 [Vitis riparia]|uniref:putative SNAP25 homologous protein SNAP30 n=1 Tax=Vitis riparia TaxID=96939 RepID=UPI00155AB8E7|nr:putative SNAP25 homologous protein SNAP30 [Vitis riparia]XP_034704199.1 putative SNAP25 homologous protein SNAP30 [Vitis riparia]
MMFGFMKSPMNKVFKHNAVDPGPGPSNPFDSDTENDSKQIHRDSKRAASEPTLPGLNFNIEDQYKNDFRDSGGLENQSVQELENYAAYKAKETTKTVNNCLKIAEDIREDATNTLATLHQQGEQITRTHMMAADMDKDLSKGEKLLGNLGGMFSRTWKPKKSKDITGPLITSEDSKGGPASLEQRQKLGLAPAPKGRTTSRAPGPEPTAAMQQVEGEMLKQDDALSDLSNILGDLKNMAADMGSELDRQNKALDHLSDDVDELNARVKGANQRARRLLAK